LGEELPSNKPIKKKIRKITPNAIINAQRQPIGTDVIIAHIAFEPLLLALSVSPFFLSDIEYSEQKKAHNPQGIAVNASSKIQVIQQHIDMRIFVSTSCTLGLLSPS
jgi:hypothetical protein